MIARLRGIREAVGPGSAVQASIEAWRRMAMDRYALALAAIHLPFVLGALISVRLALHTVAAIMAAWGMTVAASLLRGKPLGVRIWLLVGAVWLYAIASLGQQGVFGSFRVTMESTPVVVIILAGVWRGLAVGAVNLSLVLLALWATSRGWLPQSPPPWQPGDALLQAAMIVGKSVSGLVLMAAFSHHLYSSLRQQYATAALLRREAAERERLEGEVLVASERECRRIGSELHDGVCQDLTGLLLQSRRLSKALLAGDVPASVESERLVAGLGEAIGELHGLSRRLSPGGLKSGDLPGALRDLCLRVAAGTEVSVVFEHHGGLPELAPGAALHLFRIAQEGLANAARHAAAQRVVVRLESTEEGARLLVEDDGVGLPPDAADQGGLGLHTTTWRARQLGGTLTWGRRDEGGTRMACWIPSKGPTGGEVTYG